MHGNTPYAGQPEAEGVDGNPQLTPTQRRELRAAVGRVARRTREFLPGEYVVGSDVTQGYDGPEATVAVQPPVGNPVSAGLVPDIDELDAGEAITDEELEEVAQGLAASAALQVKNAVSGAVTPTAR